MTTATSQQQWPRGQVKVMPSQKGSKADLIEGLAGLGVVLDDEIVAEADAEPEVEDVMAQDGIAYAHLLTPLHLPLQQLARVQPGRLQHLHPPPSPPVSASSPDRES